MDRATADHLKDIGRKIAAPAQLSALIEDALTKYRTSCLWSIKEIEHPTIANGMVVAGYLKRNGDAAAFQLAGKIESACASAAGMSVDGHVPETSLEIDTSFSFFPVISDHQQGYKPHPFDLATNKALAAAGRREARDIIDLINLDKNYIGLGAIVWAAVAKDPGFSPSLLLEHISRNSAHSDEEYELLDQTDPITAKEAKAYLLDALNRARDFIDIAPPNTLGHAFLNSKGRPCQPAPNEFGAYTLHTASPGGVWPSIPEMDSRLIHESNPDTSEPSGPP